MAWGVHYPEASRGWGAASAPPTSLPFSEPCGVRAALARSAARTRRTRAASKAARNHSAAPGPIGAHIARGPEARGLGSARPHPPSGPQRRPRRRPGRPPSPRPAGERGNGRPAGSARCRGRGRPDPVRAPRTSARPSLQGLGGERRGREGRRSRAARPRVRARSPKSRGV